MTCSFTCPLKLEPENYPQWVKVFLVHFKLQWNLHSLQTAFLKISKDNAIFELESAILVYFKGYEPEMLAFQVECMHFISLWNMIFWYISSEVHLRCTHFTLKCVNFTTKTLKQVFFVLPLSSQVRFTKDQYWEIDQIFLFHLWWLSTLDPIGLQMIFPLLI